MLSFALFRRHCGPALAFLAASAPLVGAWTPPADDALARLERALVNPHAQFDPAEQMIRRPFSSPGYHTALTGGFVHPTRDSLVYAVGLLDTGQPAHLERAVGILRRVIALQDTNPANKTYGIWSWFLEEPLAKMNPPDWNWADFNGVTLLQVARDHRDRLPADLARAVDEAILHAARAIKKRNVGPGYTNIAIMGAYVTLVAGETLQQPEFVAYGRDRLVRIEQYTRDNADALEEYNSPTYTVVALQELSRLKAHVRDPAAQPAIDYLLRCAWTEVATHFHAPTRQWAGPHSRAYGSLLGDRTLALIQRATAGRVDFGVDAPDREDLRLPLACPPDLEPLFRELPAARTVTETFIKRNNTVGTTYLHPLYALGTVNQGDLWNQRRALLLHFGTAAEPGYLHLRFLKNDYDFSSARIATAQREGLAVGVVHLVTDGGDTHISLDLVKQATIRARTLRLRFEFGGPAAAGVRIAPAADGRSAAIAAGNLALALDVLRARFDGRDAALVAGGDATRKWLDVVLCDGPERAIDLATVQEAVAGFALSVGPHGAVAFDSTNGQLVVQCDGLTARAPVKPVSRKSSKP